MMFSFVILTVLSLQLSSQLAAQDASDWSKAHRSSIRLIAGAGKAGLSSAGLEIRLSSGFKTYWRSPGDSGIPPRFDWSTSENLDSVTVKWPAPVRFSDGSGHSVGYASDVILPLNVKAQDPTKPVRLSLNLDYAVCEKICIPAQGKAELVLIPDFKSARSGAVMLAKDKVPSPIKFGDTSSAVALTEATTQEQDGSTIIVLNGTGSRVQLEAFLEGPDMWVFSVPIMAASGGNNFTITFKVEDQPKGPAARIPLGITLAGPAGAVEALFELDMPAGKR
jgi:DsbC/DsbD-like thiol-disulfide interchange protein